MGALISFKLAQFLYQQSGLCPQLILISAHRDLYLPDQYPIVHTLPECEFVERVRSLNGIPDEFWQQEELKQLILLVLWVDFAVCETYHYILQDPLLYPISAFGGLQHSEVSRDELMDWKRETCHTFKLRMLPGYHFFLKHAYTQFIQTIKEDLIELYV